MSRLILNRLNNARLVSSRVKFLLALTNYQKKIYNYLTTTTKKKQLLPIIQQQNLALITQRYSSSDTPANFGIMFVPQQEAWVIERMGKFHKILNPVILDFESFNYSARLYIISITQFRV